MSEFNSNTSVNSKKPKVSVCIASYNHAQYLEEMLDSVLAQTFRDFEVVIVDDGSKDNSLEILNRYAEKFPQIKVFTHPENQNKGISATTNLAIEHSRGEYISFIGSDDIWKPHLLERQVNFIQENQLTLAYSRVDCINEHGDSLNISLGEDVSGEQFLTEILIADNPIPAIAVTVHKAALDKVGRFDEKVLYSDWELWIRLSLNFKFGFIRESLAKYRIHNTNTSIGIDRFKQFQHKRQIYYRLLEKAQTEVYELRKYKDFIRNQLNLLAEQEALFQLDRYFSLIAEKKYSAARQALQNALNLSSTTVIQPRRILAITKHAVLATTSKITSLIVKRKLN